MSQDGRTEVAVDAPAWGKREDMRLLNADVERLDGPVKVRGEAVYTHDVRLPRMVYARILTSPYPVAKPEIRTSKAEQVDGVRFAEVLGEGLADGWVRRLGQPVAVVAADSPEQAADGLRALEVEWELGDWCVDREQALAKDAPLVSTRGRGDGNVRFVNERGDHDAAEEALNHCNAVVEATYSLPVQHHACLETHGVVVDYRGGDEATIYASTQGTFTVSKDAAEILDLPERSVRTVVQHMGGGFGAKFGLDVPGRIACAVAKALGRPVHLMLSRADEMVTAGNRSGSVQWLKGGAKSDGTLHTLLAIAEKYGGMGRGAFPRQPYIYDAEVSWFESKSVLTNTDGSRAMRAPGHPQASFGIESLIDELAAKLSFDPVEFRKKNLSDPVYHRQLDRVAAAIGWAAHENRHGPPSPKRLPELAYGIGFGVSTWGSGGRPSCEVEVKIESDGSVVSAVGTQDLGTGTRTYVASIVAEELGLPLAAVEARIGDSTLGSANASGGSVTVPCLAPAVKDAAFKAKGAILEHVAPQVGVAAAQLELRVDGVFQRGGDVRLSTWREACSTLPVGGLAVRGTFRPDLAARGVHGAQAAKVEVDTLTGEYRVIDMVCVQDCGIPLNRMATRSQVQGAMVESLSYGLYEERLIDPDLGVNLNAGFEEYRIAGLADVPAPLDDFDERRHFLAILDDEDEREAVLGIGEPPIIPGQSAIANAIYNACGVRLRDLPLSRDKLIAGLDALRAGGGR